jgi:hypothetical protein
VLLLASDQVTVAYRVRLEARGDDEVRVFEVLRLVLDSEGLDPLPDEFVDVRLTFRLALVLGGSPSDPLISPRAA